MDTKEEEIYKEKYKSHITALKSIELMCKFIE